MPNLRSRPILVGCPITIRLSGKAVRITGDTVERLGTSIISGRTDLADPIIEFLQGAGVTLDSKGFFAAVEHPDTQFAWLLRNSTSGVQNADIVITHAGGVCAGDFSCDTAIRQILPSGWTFNVHYPDGSGGVFTTPFTGVGPPP